MAHLGFLGVPFCLGRLCKCTSFSTQPQRFLTIGVTFAFNMAMRLYCTLLLALFYLPLFSQTPDSVEVVMPDTTASQRVRKGSVKGDKLNAPVRDTIVFASDSIPASDSPLKTPARRRSWLTKHYPNPRVAALFSAVLPGAGQAYNKKWWKIPLVWGALGGIGYFTFDTQNTYREFRDSYKLLVDGDPETNPTEAPYNTFDATRTKSYRDTFKGYTEKWYLALGVTYLLVVTDAFVDAHLTRFDVSDDLSMRIKPSLETSSGLPVFGLGISFAWHKPTTVRPLTFSAHP